MSKLTHIKTALKVAKAFTSEHSPEILTGVSIAASAVAIIFAIKQTPKAMKHLEDKKMEVNAVEKETSENPEAYMERDLTLKEAASAIWKDYIPVVAPFAVCVASAVGSTKVSADRIAAAGAAVVMAQDELTRMSEKATELLGEKKVKEIRDAIAAEKVQETDIPPDNTIVKVGTGNTLCMDYYTKRYFYADIDEVKNAVLDFTTYVQNYDTGSLNDWYDHLGIDRIEGNLGERVGWNIDHIFKRNNRKVITLDPTSTLKGDQTAYVVRLHPSPEYGYEH